MDVLLIYPPSRLYQRPVNPPIGLANIARALIDCGHNVTILDIQAHRLSNKETLDVVRKSRCDVIGIGGLVTTYNYIKDLTEEIKAFRPDVPIIAGGSVSTPMYKLLLRKTSVDIAVIGEGEHTTKELLDAFEEKRELTSVKSICYKDDGIIYATPLRNRLKADEIPVMPAWELFDLETYFNNTKVIGLDKAKPSRRCEAIITSRGCPNRCTFCFRNFGQKLVFRNLDHVINEIRYFTETFDVHEFAFLDELFMVSEKRIYDFCRRLRESNLNIRFRCSARGNTLTENMVKALKEVGLISVGVGFESGSQRMLDRMQKGTTVQQYKKMVEILNEYDVHGGYTFIYGMPGETPSTIRETIKFIKCCNIDPRKYGLFVATPYPGTQLYTWALEKKLIHDEEAFVSELDDATKFVVNLTEMTDEEFMRRKNRMALELRISYYLRNRLYRSIFRDVLGYLRKVGLKRMLKKLKIT